MHPPLGGHDDWNPEYHIDDDFNLVFPDTFVWNYDDFTQSVDPIDVAPLFLDTEYPGFHDYF